MTTGTATPTEDSLDEEEDALPSAPPAPPRTRWWQHVLDAVLVTVVTSGVVTWLYRLPDADLRVPLAYTVPSTDVFAAGDATFHQALTVALSQGHWWTNPQLGAPFGSQFYDFPIGGDNLHVVALWALARLTGDPFLAVNLYFLGGYVLIALVGWGVARLLGLSRPSAVAVALLFTFAPFHQAQGEGHLFLAGYVAVPLGALLLNWQLSGFAEWGPGRRPGDRGLTGRRLLAVLPVGLVVGSGSAYLAYFALVPLALTAVAQALFRRSPRPLAAALVLGGVPSAVLLANLAPALLYRHEHGANITLQRPPLDTWYFGLDIAQLFSPVQGHRVGPLARLSTEITASLGWTEPGNNLGLIGSVGLVGLVVVLARRLLRRGGPVPAGQQFRARQAWLAVLSLLLASVGGVAVLLSVLGPSEVRVWARMSIYLTFFALCAVGSWLDDLVSSARSATPRRVRLRSGTPARWLVAAALVGIGVLDQTTAATATDQRAARAAFASDARFGAEATRLLGEGAMVFQLPQTVYPEGGPRRSPMYDYDLLKGYMHAPELRWSYGATKGRPEADWQVPVGADPPEDVVVELAAAGFAGLYVDREGYPDRKSSPVASVQRLLGEEPLVSPDGRLVLFDLRPLRQRLVDRFGADEVRAAGRDVTAPLVAETGSGFYPRQPGAGPFPRASRSTGTLQLDNPSSSDEAVQLRISAATASLPGRLTVTAAGKSTSLDLTTESQALDLALTLPPGRTTVRLHSTTPDRVIRDPLQPDARFVVQDVTVRRDVRTAMVDVCRPPSPTSALSC